MSLLHKISNENDRLVHSHSAFSSQKFQHILNHTPSYLCKFSPVCILRLFLVTIPAVYMAYYALEILPCMLIPAHSTSTFLASWLHTAYSTIHHSFMTLLSLFLWMMLKAKTDHFNVLGKYGRGKKHNKIPYFGREKWTSRINLGKFFWHKKCSCIPIYTHISQIISLLISSSKCLSNKISFLHKSLPP